MHVYKEPLLSVLILDFCKPIESRLCLESVQNHIKVPHKVIFCDNGGGEDYPAQFVREGLVDQLVVNRDSTGLGLGTRDLFALSFSPYTAYIQNDQIITRDLYQEEFDLMVGLLGTNAGKIGKIIMSVSLAGSPCGQNIYSERAYLIQTEKYKEWERTGLSYHGAGPYHDGLWREEQIQKLYTNEGWIHFEWVPLLVADNGVFAVRDMKDGGLWLHRTDTKQLWCIKPPILKNPAYPKLTKFEFELAAAGKWPDGEIPFAEDKDSFHCWDRTWLAQHQDEYVANLREKTSKKKYNS